MKNRYTQDKSASAEILRLLLQKMAAHPAAFTPFTYAVWYEFVTGINPLLSKAMSDLLAANQPLDTDIIHELYTRHVADSDIEAEQSFKQNMERVLEDMKRFAEQTDGDAGRFNAGLQRHGEMLTQDLDAAALQELIGEVASETQSMRSSVEQLQDKLRESKSEVERLRLELVNARSEALTDPLTGVFNRRGFESQMRSLLANPDMQGRPACFLMLDIDHFKKINDTYGHLFGDKVIRLLAEVLKAQVKGQDTVARMGGEEFAIVLPNTPVQGASVVAEHIRKLIEKGKIRRLDKDESVGGITISIGIATSRIDPDWATALSQADEALYASKQQGRNRITVYTPGAEDV